MDAPHVQSVVGDARRSRRAASTVTPRPSQGALELAGGVLQLIAASSVMLTGRNRCAGESRPTVLARGGAPPRLLCASMSDVFEPRSDLEAWRRRLWTVIDATPGLDWLLLTKCPDQIASKVPWGCRWPDKMCGWERWPENQLWATRRLPVLIQHKAAVRFVSCEPLLGRIDLSPWLSGHKRRRGVDWVIVGGESGHKARPMHPEWATQ